MKQTNETKTIKAELLQKIAQKNPHLYQRDIQNIVNAVLGEITAALARGDRVELRGFGAFAVKNRPSHVRSRAGIVEPKKGPTSVSRSNIRKIVQQNAARAPR